MSCDSYHDEFIFDKGKLGSNLKICLGFVYFTETENFFTENTVNKDKNQLKYYSESYEYYQKVLWANKQQQK